MLKDDLYEQISQRPVADVHTHLRRNQLAASTLDVILFYHMLHYPMRAAGYTADWPDFKQNEYATEEQYAQYLQCWPAVAHTHFGVILRSIMRDLYQFDEPLTQESLPRLKAAFEEKNAHANWALQVLKRANITDAFTNMSWLPEPESHPFSGIHFAVEKQPDNGIDESVMWRDRLQRISEHCKHDVHTLADMRQAYARYFGELDWSGRKPFVAWISSEADFTPMPDSRADAILHKVSGGEHLTREEHQALEGVLIRCMGEAVQQHTDIFQLVYGIQKPERQPTRPVVRAAPEFASSLMFLMRDFPGLHFNILNGIENDEPTLCSLCTAFSNVSLASFWFHAFYYGTMKSCWRRRLEMVPATRLMGFFSDGYCVEWVYGKLRLVQKIVAEVLGEKVQQGICSETQAIEIADDLFANTPKNIFSM